MAPPRYLTPSVCSLHAADVGGFNKAYELSNYGLAGKRQESQWNMSEYLTVLH
jgi:hypothetical protein